MDLMNSYAITKVDFLKIDVEGMEYEVFSDENIEWIFKNVRKIAGEFHLLNPKQKEQFRKFRDTYLKRVPNDKLQIYSSDLVDIKWDLWNDHFIEYYGEVTIYIDNR
jgi:hypothetical protein